VWFVARTVAGLTFHFAAAAVSSIMRAAAPQRRIGSKK